MTDEKFCCAKCELSRFYANHVAGSSTLFDVRLAFSDVDVVNQRVTASQVMTVLMAPELAVLTHRLLGELIERYQKTHGELRIPEGIRLQEGQYPEQRREIARKAGRAGGRGRKHSS